MLDKAVVNKFHQEYHNKKHSRPGLYRTSDNVITVVLPQELLDYSNASAGHSGFGSGARAVGIRRSVPDADQALKEIFESPESLQKFIESSECDGPAYVAEVRQRHAAKIARDKIDPQDLPIKQFNLNDLYGAGTISTLLAKHKRETVMADYNTLTRREFGARYNQTEQALVA